MALLITEFSSLAVLLAAMGWFSSQTDTGHTIHPAWLLIPAFASLGVFISFIGLMYLRWVVAASAANQLRHKLVFSLLALTLISVWVYGIASTWLSLNAA
jgi:H+/Cl- antiporter ClcA